MSSKLRKEKFEKINFAEKLIFSMLIIFLAGCSSKITGKSAWEAPHETAKMPQVYFCPKDDCGKALEDSIRLANSSVHCAMYDLRLKNVISTLGAKSKSIDVKLVMENLNHKQQVNGEGIRSNKNHKDRQLMHNKFCVIDGKVVATGSFNPTENDNFRNNNNFIVVYSTALAKNYEDEFYELWGGKFAGGSGVANPVLYINDIKIENYFCPEDCSLEPGYSLAEDGGLHSIIHLIKNAKESIRVASFTFTNERIADELAKAQSRGINVTILTETKQKNVMGSQYERLKGFGLDIRLDGNKYNMHHKFMVIDGKIIETGSPNFTLGGFEKNDENMLIIHDEGLASRYVEEFNVLYEEGK